MNKQNLDCKVSAVIWPWQTGKKSERVQGPSLFFSLLSLAIAWLVAVMLIYFLHLLMASIVVIISSLIFMCSRLFPQIYYRIELLLHKFSHLVGFVVTCFLLLPFFYVFFSCGRLLQKTTGKDPLSRRLDSTVKTYWHERSGINSRQKYRRQF